MLNYASSILDELDGRLFKETISCGLFLRRCFFFLKVTLNVDWFGCPNDHRSQGVYLGPNLSSWISQKQNTVFGSSNKSEYRSCMHHYWPVMDKTNVERITYSFMFTTYFMVQQFRSYFLTVNPIFHFQTKHVKIDVRFVLKRWLTSSFRFGTSLLHIELLIL